MDESHQPNNDREESWIDLPLQSGGPDGQPHEAPLPEVPATPSLTGATTITAQASPAEGKFDEIEDENEHGEPRGSTPTPLRERWLAGMADLVAQGSVLAAAVLATYLMGISVGLGDWPPFLVFVTVFSFLYWFIPLAFWGQTPGMAWRGHTAFALGGEPLSFGQTALRWVGGWLTLSLVGLPLLLALTGRSLTDRLSESETLSP